MGMKVTYDGVEHEVGVAGIGDMMAFEAKYGIPSEVFDADDPTPLKVEWIGFIAWRRLRRTGVIAKDVLFDEDFADLLDNVETDGPVADASAPDAPAQVEDPEVAEAAPLEPTSQPQL